MSAPAASEDYFPQARFGASYLSASLERLFGSAVGELECRALPGDASDRTYFRATFQKGAGPGNPGSVIVMQLQEPISQPETDFTRILKFLRGLDLPAPVLYHYDVEKGLLFLEDCGPHTLEDHLRERPQDRAQFYRRAVELLVQMQTRATRALGPDCPAYHLRFDVEKLMWEFDFMLEHYVGGLCGAPLEEPERQEVRAEFLPLCATLAAQDLCFTHRDYHSRNLMVDGDRLVLIDFQDARQGPCQYDLVSLLRDSYMQIDDTLREELTDLYICLKEEEDGREVDREEFGRIFDWMAVQRNLKAVGTFAYQSVKKNNDRYTGYISPTLEYVRQTLDRRFGSSPLREALIKHIPGMDGGGAVRS
ncbi:MAG: phosphotransferase [Nitrospinae bacterium]|nr:phosphotransferase [Nitrospinota bacterium]